jgi:hypothetical protein
MELLEIPRALPKGIILLIGVLRYSMKKKRNLI